MSYIEDEIKRLKIEEKLKSILFIKNPGKHSLEWGMNYVTFSPSKRARPLLLLEANLIWEKPDNDAYILASALELVHTYSLVHDDLPCMDDDDMRRGVKTLHTIKNEAYAVLVGDSILTRVFEILSLYSKKERINEVIKIFTLKAGYRGMIYGQTLDMEAEGKKLSVDMINKINSHKTGALLELSMILGAINTGAAVNKIKQMEVLGSLAGQIFQLQDDLLDITGDSKILGKNTGSDKKNNKSSLPLILGIEKTKNIISGLKEEASKCINNLDGNKEFFYKFIDFLVNRTK